MRRLLHLVKAGAQRKLAAMPRKPLQNRSSFASVLLNTAIGALSLTLLTSAMLESGCSAGQKGQHGVSASGGASGSSSGAGGLLGMGGTIRLDAGSLSTAGTGHPSGGACGDGAIQRSEGCDDGNRTDGDGCSRICQLEANWNCPTEGMPCVYLGVCGNGVLTTNKACDDGNTMSGDGCSSDCQSVEPGYICRVPGKPCSPLCGDGVVKGYETCDDGNAMSGDGCSATCKVEPGFDCSSGTCKPTVCGNGKLEAGETCDDGNTLPYDGCSPTCGTEPQCGTSTSAVGACKTVCGDGILLRGTEECDDGNVLDHDGCSHDCKIEPGYTCTSAYDNPPPSLTIPLVARDFQMYQDATTGHPDFNHYCCNETKGIVASTLGLDRKPVWAGPDPVTNPTTLMFTGKSSFDQWYRDVSGVNQTFYQSLTLLQSATNKTTYAMNSDTDPPWFDRCGFFPLDSNNPITDQNTGAPVTYMDSAFPGRTCHAYQGLGFGNSWANHNFSFTTELRYWFQYQGNENLKFTGDDDVWVFVNGTLAVDLGGVHNRAAATVILDAANGTGQVGYGDTPSSYTTTDFKLTVGSVYEVVVFQAERWCCGSNYELTLANFLAGKSQCVPACGDGVAVGGEECDCGTGMAALPAGCPGPNDDTTYGGCTTNCTWGPFCGDSVVQSPPAGPEQCDLGKQNGATTTGADRCSIACQNPRVCGDGVADTDLGEQCDLGPNNGVALDDQMQPTDAGGQIYCNTDCTIPMSVK
jgi:fibro-slime domain-containing protein